MYDAVVLIAEEIDDEGMVIRTTLDRTDQGIELCTGDTDRVVVPARAVLLAMRKFGRELDSEFAPNGPKLDLGSGYTLSRLDFRAAVDAEPRSYLVLESREAPTVCALSLEIAAALRFLGNA